MVDRQAVRGEIEALERDYAELERELAVLGQLDAARESARRKAPASGGIASSPPETVVSRRHLDTALAGLAV